MASSVDKNVNVNVNAKDNATAPLNSVASKFDGISNQLSSMSSLPGPIGDAVRGIGNAVSTVQDAFKGLGAAFTSAEEGASGLGAAMTAAMGPVVLAIAAIAAGLIALATIGDKTVDSFTKWADAVDSVRQVTGASAELSSALAYVGEVTTGSADTVSTAFAMMARQAGMAQDAQNKYNEKIADASDKASQQIADIGQKYTDQIEKTVQTAANRIQDIQDSLNTSMGDMLSSQSQRADDYASKLQDLQESLQDKLSGLEQSHADRTQQIAQNKADATAQVQQNAADRQDQLTQKLSDLEQQKADAIASYSEKIANATTEAQKLALAAQYNAALANINKQETDAQQAAAKADARDQANLQKQLDRLNKQQAAEDAANAKAEQQAKDQEAKAEAAANKAYQRQEAAAQKAYDRHVQQAQKMEADIAATRDAAVADAEQKRNAEQSKVLDALKQMEANRPSNAFIDALQSMNIKFDDWIKLPTDQKIKTLIDGFSGVTDQQTKTYDEMVIFGRGGKEMNDVLEYIQKNGLTNIEQKVKDSGLALSDTQIEMGKTAGYAKNELSKSLEGLSVTLGEKLAPAQLAMNESFSKTINTYAPQFQDAMKGVADSIGRLYDNLTKVSNWVNNNMGGITGAINTISGLFNTLNTLNGFTPTGFIANTISSALGFRAGGGPVGAGQPYVVGERGPELFTPNNSGWISPNVTNNYNYSPTYGQSMAPNEPASFNLFKAMVGAS